MDLVTPEVIDGSFVPRRSSVASVEVDGEMVVAGGPDLVFYRLDPLASLIWSCLDGSGTTEEIAADLAAELGAAPAVVADDVIGLTRVLGRLCLLEGVHCDEAMAASTRLPTGHDAEAPSVPRRMIEPPSG